MYIQRDIDFLDSLRFYTHTGDSIIHSVLRNAFKLITRNIIFFAFINNIILHFFFFNMIRNIN